MSEKKRDYMQGEMRPLSAFARGGEPAPAKEKRSKRTPPARVPVPQNNIGNTVMSLTGQNKITDTSTIQRTPFRTLDQMQRVKEQVSSEPVPAMKREADETERVPAPPVIKQMPERSHMHTAVSADIPETMRRSEIPAEPLYEPIREAETFADEPEFVPETESVPETEPDMREPELQDTADEIPQPETDIYETETMYEAEPESLVQSIQQEIMKARSSEPEPVFETMNEPAIRKNRRESVLVRKTEPVPMPAAVPVRRRAVAPDLSNKAEREEFFSKYTNKRSHRHIRPTAAKKDNTDIQAESLINQPVKTDEPHENPFLRRENPFLRSQRRREAARAAEQAMQEQETAQTAVNDEENIRPEMRETIEGVFRMQRQERESAAEMEREALRGGKSFHTVRGIAIMGVVLLTGVFMLIGEKPVYSPQENRALAEMPEFSLQSLMRKEYTYGVSGCYNDTVPMRSVFKKTISSLNEFKGFPGFDKNETVFYGSVSEMGEVPENALEIGESVVIRDLRAMSLYSGSKDGEERYAELINEFTESLPAADVYSMVIPTSASFYLTEGYEKYSASEKDSIDKIGSLLEDAVNVDVYSVLAEHKDEEIYARTDHHWLPLGAYYASEVFAKAADTDFTYKARLTSNAYSGYVGSMYTVTGNKVLSGNPETFEYFLPAGSYDTEYYDTTFRFQNHGELIQPVENYSPVNYYSVFMGGNDSIVHVSTDAGNGRTLVVFKDSFANAMIPCLTTSFSDIYVCDITTFELNAHAFCENTGATDVLFAVNTFSAAGDNLDCLEDIIIR